MIFRPVLRDKSIDWGWASVTIAYLLVFGAILIGTAALPYALDNNESFSSLWHARNLVRVGFGPTRGLADEVFAWHRSASPYVHTHQGNFPRIYATVLYLIGFRSMESQIVATVLTVGLSSIWLAYRFLRSLWRQSFAVVTCLLLITDYALFGQWEFNTYRVWYGFFFFSSLLWVRHGEPSTTRRWWLTGWLNFTAMFYGEYVFACWVALCAALYLTVATQWNRRSLFKSWLAIGAGGATAGTILLLQLVSYMGWSAVGRDISYTLKARNMAVDPQFAAKVNHFYAEHHVVFWQNYLDTGPLRSLRGFQSSILQGQLQYWGSWTIAATFTLLLGGTLGTLGWAGQVRRRPEPLGDGPAAVAVQSPNAGPRFRRPIFQIACGSVILAVAVFLLGNTRSLLPSPAADQAVLLFGMAAPPWCGALAFAGCAVLAIALAASARERNWLKGIRALSALTACALVAYAIVYPVFTGYIYSGYLNRQAPFLVFWTDALLGGGLTLIWHLTFGAEGSERRTALDDRSAPGIPARSLWHRLGKTGERYLAPLLLSSFVVFWLILQSEYFRAVPPTNYSFVRQLSKPPFVGQSFVVNTYPAPIADKTRAWAYAESNLLGGRIALGATGYTREVDPQYRWFADAGTNEVYSQPAFGLLIHQPSTIGEALQERIDRLGSRASSSAAPALFRGRFSEPLQWFIEDRLAASDGVHFAAVRFDWDFPPYLVPLGSYYHSTVQSMSFNERVAADRDDQQINHRWRVVIEVLDRPGPSAAIQAGPELTETTIDGRPIFDANTLRAAGWEGVVSPSNGTLEAINPAPGFKSPLATVVEGDKLRLRLRVGPGTGLVRVTINAMSRVLDLERNSPGEETIEFEAGQPYGIFNALPSMSPGLYVATNLRRRDRSLEAVVEYSYAHQASVVESATTARLYHEDNNAQWQLTDEWVSMSPMGPLIQLRKFRRANRDLVQEYDRVAATGDRRTFAQWVTAHLSHHPAELGREGIVPTAQSDGSDTDTARSEGLQVRRLCLPVPSDMQGRWQCSVSPGTLTKSGPEYFGLPFSAQSGDRLKPGETRPIAVAPGHLPAGYKFPFGNLLLHVRMPLNRLRQREPLVTAGVTEAADFVFVEYTDPKHIRIGFDHWFKGGPTSEPIALDYARIHTIKISLGSFYPAADDPHFHRNGRDPGITDKRNRKRRDRRAGPFCNSKSDSYPVSPSQISVGRNDIHGSSAGPRFTGQIVSVEREWPENLRP